MKRGYKNQVSLLLSVIPEVAKEKCFAIHGGTAINLFVRNMPRLSVDLDLTYVPIEDRNASIEQIGYALKRIKAHTEKVIPEARVVHREGVGKLQISARGAIVKLEVNMVNRGLLGDPIMMNLCEKAENDFEAFCTAPVVPIGQLYGGKICAALDRQHPRDMFDIKYLLQNEGFSDQVKEGFLLCLLCSDRPINEIIAPKFQDQRSALENQFSGMTDEVFSYEDFENIRKDLIKTVRAALIEEDKLFLLSVKNLTPNWNTYNFRRFPAISWKLENLQKLKNKNEDKYRQLYNALEKRLR